MAPALREVFNVPMNHLWAAAAAAALPDGLWGASRGWGCLGLCGIAGPFLPALCRCRARAGAHHAQGMMGAPGGPTPCPTPLGGSELLSPAAGLWQMETVLLQ